MREKPNKEEQIKRNLFTLNRKVAHLQKALKDAEEIIKEKDERILFLENLLSRCA